MLTLRSGSILIGSPTQDRLQTLKRLLDRRSVVSGGTDLQERLGNIAFGHLSKGAATILPELDPGELGVDQNHNDRLMAQDFLESKEAHARVEEACGICMTERMEIDPVFRVEPGADFRHRASELVVVGTGAILKNDQVLGSIPSRICDTSPLNVLDQGYRLRIDWNQAFDSEFDRRNTDRDLVWLGPLHTAKGELAQFADPNSSRANQQNRLVRKIIGFLEKLLEPEIELRVKRPGQALGRPGNQPWRDQFVSRA